MSDQIWLAIITTIGGVCLEYLRRIHKKVTACGDPECRKTIKAETITPHVDSYTPG